MPDLSFLDGKRVLITGGTGTVGSELVKTLVLLGNANVIRILTNDENSLYAIGTNLASHENIRLLLGDVRDKTRLLRAFQDIDIVFHLASLKHVSISEYNPFESVYTNVIGTQNVIDAAIENNVEKVLFTSSDKAANPNSVLGASKLLAEKLITAANLLKGSKAGVIRRSIFASIRFGNVLGSRGSVIPHVREQLKVGKNATLTHPDMTRFIMSINDAINILLRSTQLMRGGEVFVPKMVAVKIQDLISVTVKHFSNIGSEDVIEFDITGPKAGEKLHEELFTEEESRRALETDNMFVIIPDIVGLSENLLAYYTKFGAKKAPVGTYSSKTSVTLDSKGISELISKIEL